MALGGGTIDLPTIRQRLDVDGTGLSSLKSKFGGIGKALGGAVAGGALVAAAGVGTFIAKGISGAVGVERGLREVVTLFGDTGEAAEERLKSLTGQVSDLSTEVGIAQEELVGGLYSAISAGVPEDNAFEFMRVASKASIAGVTDVETAVDGLSSTINAFGLDASDAEAVSDSMFAAVQGGKTTFEELSASLYNIAPAAAAAGVSFEEVNAGIATLTAGGTPTAQATTQMRAALVGLQRPSEEMTAIFQEAGYESAQAALESEGLAASLGVVADAADGDNGKMQQLLGSVEAVAAANVIAGTGADKMAQELDRQAGAAGSTQTAFETMEEGVGRQWETMVNTIRNGAIQVGSVILPMINQAFEAVGPYVEKFSSLITSLVEGDLGGLTAAVSSIFGGGEGGGGGFVGPIAGAVEMVRELFGKLVGFVQEHMGQFREIISAVLELVGVLWDLFGEHIMTFIRETFDAVMRIVGGALDVIQGIFETVLGLLTGDWSRAWEGIKQIVGGVWNIIRGIVEAAISRLKFIVNSGLTLIKAIFGGVWENIKSAVSAATRAVVGYFADMISGARAEVSSMVSFVRGLPGRILSAIGNLGRLLYNAGRNIIDGLIDGIRSRVQAVRDTISSVASTVRNFLPFSPAREGPLSGSGAPDRAGRQIGAMLADGIRSSQGQVRSAAGALAGAVNGNLPDSAPFGPGAGPGGRGGAGGFRQDNTFHVQAFDPAEAARELGREQVLAMHMLPAGG